MSTAEPLRAREVAVGAQEITASFTEAAGEDPLAGRQ